MKAFAAAVAIKGRVIQVAIRKSIVDAINLGVELGKKHCEAAEGLIWQHLSYSGFFRFKNVGVSICEVEEEK